MPARPERFDRVNAALLDGFPELCASLGGDPDDLYLQIGMVAGPAGHRPAALTYAQFVDLLALASRSLSCPDFGMRLARQQAGTLSYGPLGTVMRHSRTLGEALDFVIGHAHVHSAATRIARHSIPGSTAIVFSHEIMVARFPQLEQTMEYVLLAGHLGAQALTDGRARVRQVLLRHRPVGAMSVYRRNFGCEVLFDQVLDGIVFGARDLACAIVEQDVQVHAEAVAAVAKRFPRIEPPIQAAVRASVLRLMQVGLASNEHVAGELGMHPRTLHRRLSQAGTSFQGVKDEVRCELVRYYLTHPEVSLLWIAGRLGFAEQAVLTRFCRHHFGLAPRELRKRIGKGRRPVGSSEFVKRGPRAV